MRHTLSTIAAFLVATSCMAWGQKGHDTTCAIAQQHLTDKAKARIADILDRKSILYWSNWLDNAVHTPEYAYAKTWHYKNIDEGQSYSEVPPFADGDVVWAIEMLTAKMEQFEQNATATASQPLPADQKAEETLALKMLVHLVGDLHQPMHMGHATDLGGNQIKVKFFGRDANLHSVWDTNLVESAHAWSHSEWVEEIDRTTPAEAEAIVAGTVSDWGQETFNIAGEIYADTPEGTKISYDYVAKWAPVVEQQFLRGGLRLAALLNEIFK